jgi:hypothetical protein
VAVQPPSIFHKKSASETALDLLGHEVMAEKASSLGRAGTQVEATLAALQQHDRHSNGRNAALTAAAEAVYAYFIQRELCGFRRHQDVIREYGIPNEVLARLGAK